MPNKKRFINGFLANGFGQGVTILIQILSIPLLISIWGIEKYGEWVIIYSLPSYLALSDFGFTIASGSMISMLSMSESQQRLAVYQTSWIVVTLLSIAITLLATGLVWMVDMKSFLSISNFGATDLAIIFSVLFLYVMFCMQTGMIQVAYRAIKMNPTGAFFGYLLRLFEWAIGMVGVFFFQGGLLTLAVSFLAVRVVGNMFMFIHLKLIGNDLYIGIRYFDKNIFKELTKPSLSALAFPLGLALSLQGVLVVISHALGPIAVAIYSILRTLSRIVIQFATAINQALLPELSYMYGEATRKKIPAIIYKSQLYAALISSVGCVLIYVYSEEILHLWVNQEIGGNQMLLLALLASSFIHVIWQPLWVAQMAVNVHAVFAICFVLVAFGVLLISSVLMNHFDLLGVGLAVLIGEVALLFSAIVTYKKYLYPRCV